MSTKIYHSKDFKKNSEFVYFNNYLTMKIRKSIKFVDRFYTQFRFVICLFCFGLLLANCATKPIRPRYYILDYRPTVRDSTLFVQPSFPYKLQVQTMKIPRTYDRVNIVVRFTAHQLDYYRYSLWAIRPQITISDLIADHISEYGTFQKCQREFLNERPDYEISGTIEAIEKFDNPSYSAAHLAMKLYLRSYDGYDNLLIHEFNREEEMREFQMELFAKKLSDILQEEIDNFIRKMIVYFNQKSDRATLDLNTQQRDEKK